MGPSNVVIQNGTNLYQLVHRFDAMAFNLTSGGMSVNTVGVLSGVPALIYPGGEPYRITGNGLKLHPAVGIVGFGPGSTVIDADVALSGDPDDAGGEYALLYINARTPSATANVEDMWQPIISNLAFRGGNAPGNKINGCALEAGSADPFFPYVTGGYRGGSASFRDCGFYDFPKFGVFSLSNRQRLHAQYLRCTGNGLTSLGHDGGGLRILGNDPVVGERCAFGGNDGFQFAASAISGVILVGVNMYTAGGPRGNPGGSSVRSDTALACLIHNCNGATISGCVFNDTLVLEGEPSGDGDNTFKGISVSGCDFNPNDGLFTGPGVPPAGGGSAVSDTFIRVDNLLDVTW